MSSFLFSKPRLALALRGVVFVALLLLAITSVSAAQQLVVLQAGQVPDAESAQIAEVAQHYGLSLTVQNVSSRVALPGILSLLRNPDLRAVLVSYAALPALKRKDLLGATQRPNRSVPILIFGADARDDAILSYWSQGAISECTPLSANFHPAVLELTHENAMTGTLAGWKLPAVTSPICKLQTSSHAQAENIINAKSDSAGVPVLLRIRSGGQIFISPRLKFFDDTWIGEPLGISKAVSSWAPFLLFIKYAAGEYGWHLVRHYANLTIDDPWLVEPYGHLEYKALLTQMQQHNFHTTIAFIPWNYDRSREEVAELFRENPERYSICIHGDDHDHQEFAGESPASIADQRQKIKQGIARMERFRALTGVSYDRFMVFPHSVAAERTFAELNRYGFSGTANSVHVPTDATFPREPMFLLRSYTNSYGGLLSMFRYSAEGSISQLDVAIQSFLGNPLLFYGHQQLFDGGIDTFNRTADFVNRLQPETHWASLGEIAKHLYLVRIRGNNALDVRMLSNEMTFNLSRSSKPTRLYVERHQDPSLTDYVVQVNGRPAPFELEEGVLKLQVVVDAGQTAEIRIGEPNDLILGAENIGKGGIRVRTLRRVSDFRDMVLSRSALGRRFTAAYYGRGWNSMEELLESRWTIVAALVIAIGAAGLRRRRRKQRVMKVSATCSAAAKAIDRL